MYKNATKLLLNALQKFVRDNDINELITAIDDYVESEGE
jgi:hypothetical protein